MASPTTKNGGDWEEPYGRAVAQIIATLACQDGDTVARADIRQAWYLRFPHQDRSTAANKGRLGRPRMNAGIRYLAQRGVIDRDPETVRVLHGAKLVEIATSDSGRTRRGAC